MGERKFGKCVRSLRHTGRSSEAVHVRQAATRASPRVSKVIDMMFPTQVLMKNNPQVRICLHIRELLAAQVKLWADASHASRRKTHYGSFVGANRKIKRHDRAQTAATSRARCKAVGSSLTITTSFAYIKIWTCMEPARPAHVTRLQTRLISAAKPFTKTLKKNPLRSAPWPIPLSTSHEAESFEETRTAAVRWETRSSIRCHRPPDTPAWKGRRMAPSRHATSKALRISKKAQYVRVCLRRCNVSSHAYAGKSDPVRKPA